MDSFNSLNNSNSSSMFPINFEYQIPKLSDDESSNPIMVNDSYGDDRGMNSNLDIDRIESDDLNETPTSSSTLNMFPNRFARNVRDRMKPKIIIMGLRRSGKSSIQKVVFHKMSPNETMFLESTNKIMKDDISSNSFISFSIWDFPQVSMLDSDLDSDAMFQSCGAVVFVIDSQDDYNEALNNLIQTIKRVHRINEKINFEVFIHKVDGLSDDHKIEARQEILQKANEDLAFNNLENVSLSLYLTSIYDHSIFEAFSKVVQKLMPQLPVLENLLNIFISSSGIEKAFLFDVVSKIFVATDSSPVDMQLYELCCDMIDVVIDVSCIYGINENGESNTFDSNSSSCIRLKKGTVLYLREVNRFLAMVCIAREESFEKQGLIDYNFQCLRNSIQDIFNLSETEPPQPTQ